MGLQAGTAGLDPGAPEPPWGLDVRPANTTCHAPARPLPLPVRFVRQFADVALVGDTTTLVQRPDDPAWWYVVEKDGRIQRFSVSSDPRMVELVLDIVPKVAPGRELGMLGLAFHPRFAENGLAVVSYTTLSSDGDLQFVVAKFTSPDGGATLDPSSEIELLKLTKQHENHHAGNVDFGPDGYLYVGIGDGAGGGDSSQDPRSLFGKVLRIDLDTTTGPLPYGIPPDNPFVSPGHRPEVWALGLRNPWRWSFDPATGDLWLGDVGMDTIEEIDLVTRGGNYGWPAKEGELCHGSPADCDARGFVAPIASYTRELGNVVVGGHVYRGALVPEVQGQYLFNDHNVGSVYRLIDDGSGGHHLEALAYGTDDYVDWAYGADGESYTLGLAGTIWRLEPAGPETLPPLSPTLSGTGCFDPKDPTRVAEGVVPFAPAHPFWSDGLGKDRWLALPEGGVMEANAEGDLELPVGSVLLKEFADVDGRRIETRMLARHPDGWAGYSWLWREDQSDADLLEGRASVELDASTWTVPGRTECLRCHTQPAGWSLGLELRQLDVPIVYPTTGRTANQLTTLAHIGLLKPSDVAHPGPFPAKDGPEPVEDRARAWLHVNCSPCHREGGPTPVHLSILDTTPLADTGLCELPDSGDLGVPDAHIVTPGDPSTSILSLRVHAVGPHQMPPLGRATVDEQGAALIDEWIRGLESCP